MEENKGYIIFKYDWKYTYAFLIPLFCSCLHFCQDLMFENSNDNYKMLKYNLPLSEKYNLFQNIDNKKLSNENSLELLPEFSINCKAITKRKKKIK